MTNDEILRRLRARIPADVFVVVEARLKELDAAKYALMICEGSMIGKVKPSSPAFRRINDILRPGVCPPCINSRACNEAGKCIRENADVDLPPRSGPNSKQDAYGG